MESHLTRAGGEATDATGRRRRALFFGATFATSIAATCLMLDILEANGLTPLEAAGLLPFFALFTWISGAFWTTLAGYVVRRRGGDPAVIRAGEVADRVPHGRTAILMPVHNEDPARVAAGLEAIWGSLAREPGAGAFDLFVLSDTTDREIAAAELRMWRALVARHGAAGRIFYRRRTDTTGRKAGNIADFVRSWGAGYDYMVVLDADSVMSGRALVALACLMDTHPEVGIIQTLPLPAARETLFARMMQFAARLNGPVLASGLAFWQLGEGNYWGHNAILRVGPFAAHCALAPLPGRPPLGGEVLSHDFVEAAFMRRAGYRVWLVPDLEGSWEEVPSNVIDYAARDRRWVQGNLQHARVLPMRGLHWLSRIHLLTGIMAYVSSPLWLAVLLVSSAVTCHEAVTGYQYFPAGTYTLFPDWPESRSSEIGSLLAITIFLLLAPRLLGAALVFRDRALLRRFGGGLRLAVSLVCEQLFSMLLAPAMMLFHSSFVCRTMLGAGVAWNAQPRGDRGVGWREAFERHRGHVALGLTWGAAILAIAPRFIWWLLPVLAGLLASVWLTVWSSRVGTGRRARALGLLLTPEETAPPRELTVVREPPPLEAPADVAAPSGPPPSPLRMEPAPPARRRFPLGQRAREAVGVETT